MVAGHEAGVGRVRQRAGLAWLLGVVEGQDLVEVVDVARQALGSLAVEDVGADRSFFGGRGRAGEDLLGVREGQVGEPGQDRARPGFHCHWGCLLPWSTPSFTRDASSVWGSAERRNPSGAWSQMVAPGGPSPRDGT